MPTTFTSTQPGSSTDYLPYLTDHPVKTDRYMDSDLLDFKIYIGDSSFVRLKRGAYITLNTSTYGTWFSGYVTSSPTLEYFGLDTAGKGTWGYSYQATSDDYILNLQPLGFIPNYMNMSMGDIIKSMVNILAPGVFDVSNISSGQMTAQYSATPQTYFRDVIKELCQASSYVFYAKNHKLYFVQQDSLPVSLTLDWNDKYFTPSELVLNPSAVPVINQAYVLGELEPQTYVSSYFLGDGSTGTFPLISDVFGIDRFTLIQENFSGSSVNSNVWNLYNPSNNLQLVNGYLNCTGGSGGSSYDTSLQSLFPIPMEGNIRFTHGEWDFLEPSATSTQFGVICGLWTNQNPTSSLSGCLYGLMDSYNSSGAHILSPVVNGVLDSTQSVSIDNTKRYVIRTLASFNHVNRVNNTYTYTDSTGVVRDVTLPTLADFASWQTTVIEIDPVTGLVTNSTVLINAENTLSNSQLYATYIPIASSSLRATVTGITISIPIQAELEHQLSGQTNYRSQLIGANEIDSLDNTAPVATIVQGNSTGNTRSSFTGKPSYSPGQASLTYFKDSTTLESTTPAIGTSVHLSYRASGYALGVSSDKASILAESQSWGDSGVRSLVKTDLSPRPRTSQECEAAAASIVGDNNYQHYEGTYNVYNAYVASEPISGSILKFSNVPTTLPTIVAEEINQVVTTLATTTPIEVFKHQITFGKPDYVRRLIHDLYKPAGVFQPTDATSNPYAVDVSQVGSNFAPDVPAPTFTGYDSEFLYYDTNQSASVGGFELRYTDEGWGIDDGKNLIDRILSGNTFQVPRNSRSKVIYLKQYDSRNRIIFSEDLTDTRGWTTSGTATKALGVNPEGGTSTLTTLSLGVGGSVYQGLATGGTQNGTFSVSVKGESGKSLRFQVVNSGSVIVFNDVKMTGGWQRVSVYGTGVNSVQVISTATSHTFLATYASFENSVAETQYCKTKTSSWGAYSRYSSAVQVAYPLRPNSPTAVVDTSDSGSFVITVVPPALAADVRGVELRKSPNFGIGVVAGTPVVSSGSVSSIPLLFGGKNYNSPINIIITGNGTGAQATASVSSGIVTNIVVTSGGSNYTYASVSIEPVEYVLVGKQDAYTTPPPYTFTDTSPVDPSKYFPFTYNLLGEYSLIGQVEGEQPVPLNIVPSPMSLGILHNSTSNVDPLYGDSTYIYTPQTLDAKISYKTSADSNVVATLTASGKIPVNSYSSTEGLPVIEDLVVQIDTSRGTLQGGHTYYVAVCGLDSSSNLTPISKMLSVYIEPGVTNGKIVIPKITIPDPSKMVSGLIFAAMDYPQLLAQVGTFALPSVITPNPSNNPLVFTSITSAVVYTVVGTFAAPSPALDKVVVKVKPVIHSGVAGAAVTSVSTNTIVCHNLIDTSSTPDNWVGYVLSCVTNANGNAKRFNFLVTAFDASTGTFTTSSTIGLDPAGYISSLDVIIVRANATTASSTTIGNSGFINSTDSHVGLTVNQEIGYLIRIIAGKGIGQVRKIASNTTSVYTVATPFDITPDSTSFFIVEGYQWQYTSEGAAGIINPDQSASVSINITIDNLNSTMFLALIQSVTKSGLESPEELSPFVEVFMTGNPGTGSSSSTLTPASNVSFVSATPSKNSRTGNVDLTAIYTPPTDNTAKGIQGFLELPDFSYGTLLSSTSSNVDALVVPGVRIDLGMKMDPVLDSAGNVTVIFETDKPFTAFTQSGRLYLDSVNAGGTANILVPANESGPTPSLVFTVGFAENAGIGQEYAPLVTTNSIDSRGFPLLQCQIETRKTSSGWEYRFSFPWADPTAAANPDRYQQFQGVDVDLLRILDTTILNFLHDPDPMGFGRYEAPAVSVGRSTINPGVGKFISEYAAVPDPQQLFIVDALSVGSDGVNTFSPLMTPQGYFYTPLLSDLIAHGGTGTGEQAAPLADVTNFSVTAGYAYDLSGAFDYLARPFFTQPKDLTAWNDIALVLNIPAGSAYYYNLGYPSMGNGDSNDLINIDKSAWPTVPATWRFIAVSTDSNGIAKYKDLDNLTAIRTAGGTPDFGTSPTFDVAVDGPYQPEGSGIEVAPLVGSVYAQINFGQSVDGTEFYFLSGGVTGEPISDDRYFGYVIKSSVNGSEPKPIVYLSPGTPKWEGPHQPIPAGGPYSVVVIAISKNAASDENNYVPGVTPGVLCHDLLQALTTGMLDTSRSNPAKLGGGVHVSGGKLTVKTDGVTLDFDGSDNLRIPPGAIGTSLLADGTVSYAKFLAGLRPIEIVSTLPSSFTNYPAGSVVALSTNAKIYRSTGSAWTTAVAGSDIVADTALINNIQTIGIRAISVDTTWLAAQVISAAQITTGTLAASRIGSGTLPVGVIYAGTLDATQITTGSLAASRIGSGTLPVGVIYGGTIYTSQINSTNAWFQTVSIGGTSATNAVIQTDSSGNVSINGATFALTSGANSVTMDRGSLLKVHTTFSGGIYTSLSPSGFIVGNDAGTTSGSAYYSGTGVTIGGNTGISGSFNYTKPGGATGVITVVGGIVMSIT